MVTKGAWNMVTTVKLHFSFFHAWNETVGYLNFILIASSWQAEIPQSYQQFVVFI